METAERCVCWRGHEAKCFSNRFGGFPALLGNRAHPSEPADDDFAVFDGVPVPEYLRPYWKKLAHFERAALAPAFLMHLGVLKERPEYPDCSAGVSPDGRHILYKAKQGPLADDFIYGDLQTRQTVRWKCPPALQSVTSMEFVWVETP